MSVGTVTAYHERSGWGWLRSEDGTSVAFSVATAHRSGTYYIEPGYKLSYRVDTNGSAAGLAYSRIRGRVTLSVPDGGWVESPSSFGLRRARCRRRNLVWH